MDPSQESPQPAEPASPAPPKVSEVSDLLPPPLPETPSEAAPPELPAPAPSHPFQFHGQPGEFFRIWIVNTLLTLVTAGIFFAWAKVRKRRYLRGSTEFLGHRFDYRANPKRLLIGNLIVLAFFVGYTVFGVVYPPVRYGVLVIGVLLLPWIVVRSLTFNAHNTVFRGMPFRFNPSLSGSAFVYVLEPVMIVLTLGCYYPAWARSRRRYTVANHRLGDAYFRFDARTGDFYAAYVLGGLILAAAAIGAGALLALVMFATKNPRPGMFAMIPFFILYGLGLFLSRHFIHAWLFNHIWNHTRLDDHRFVAQMKIDRWLGLQLTNLGAILISCGMLYPWAVIRAHRYTASCLSFFPSGDVERIERMTESKGSAIGDTAAEFIGLDFGL